MQFNHYQSIRYLKNDYALKWQKNIYNQEDSKKTKLGANKVQLLEIQWLILVNL